MRISVFISVTRRFRSDVSHTVNQSDEDDENDEDDG